MSRTSKKKTPKPAKAKKEKKVKRGRGLGTKQPPRPPPPPATVPLDEIVPLDDSYRVNKHDVHKWAKRGALAAASIGSAYLAHKYSPQLIHAGKTAKAAIRATGPGLRHAYQGVRGAIVDAYRAGKRYHSHENQVLGWHAEQQPANQGPVPMDS